MVWGNLAGSGRIWRGLPDKILVEPEKSIANSCQNLVRESIRSLQNWFWDPPRTRPSEQEAKKSKKFVPKVGIQLFRDGLLAILGSGREAKIDKKRAQGRKHAPGESARSDFLRFFLRRCSESLSGSICGGSGPPKLCSHHSGSTILTKSPFSDKARKSRLRGLVVRAKIDKSECRGGPKSSKTSEKS